MDGAYDGFFEEINDDKFEFLAYYFLLYYSFGLLFILLLYLLICVKVTVDLSNNQIFGNLTELCLKAQDLKKITSDCISPDILCPCCTFCC